MTTTAPAVRIKTVKFAATAPIYAGETRYLAGSVSPGRTRVRCLMSNGNQRGSSYDRRARSSRTVTG